MKILLYFLSFFLLSGCAFDNESTNSATIYGKVTYPNNGYIYLEMLTPDGYLKVDSSRLDEGKSFILETSTSAESIYRINFFNHQKNSIVLRDEDVNVEADGNNELGQFYTNGTADAFAINAVERIKSEFQTHQNLLSQKIRTAVTNKDADTIDSLKTEYGLLESQFQSSLMNVINSQAGSLTSLLIMSENFELEPNLELYEGQLQLMEAKIGYHWYFNRVNDMFEKIERTAIGSVAPDFSLEDPNGKLIHLSSFQGKYLFIDFWASWCQPCRIENPELVKVYEKLKGSQFEILGVSFDKKKERWVKAIEKDGLTWPQVSDLKYLDSEMVELYNITNVPMTFLLDPDGKIIAKNLHATDLENILEELL